MSASGGQLAGKVAIVTGAGGGIGRGIALRYAAEGAVVVPVDVHGEAAEQTAATIREGSGEALAVKAHVGLSDDVDRVFDETLEAFGRVDVVVNNAAITQGIFRHALEVDEELWDRIVETNLKGTVLCALRAAREMARWRRGVIINVSSVGATRAHRGMVPYDACKGGVEAVTRALAIDMAPYSVRVVGLIPGTVFPSVEEVPGETRKLAERTVPLQRPGLPDDLAGPAVFLATDDARYMTGSLIAVDGGVLAQQRPPLAEIFPVENFPEVDPAPGA